MRKFLIILLCVTLFITLVGCGVDEAADQVEELKQDKIEAPKNIVLEENKTEELDIEEVSENEKSFDKTEEIIREDEAVEQNKEYVAGNYKVGEDIPSGEYKFFAEDNSGFISVNPLLSSGGIESTLKNDRFETFIYMSVNDGEYLEIKKATAILSKDIEPYDKDYYGPGVDKVGEEISVGEYNVQNDGKEMAYIETRTDPRGDIIFNARFENNKYITVNDGEYFRLKGVHIE